MIVKYELLFDISFAEISAEVPEHDERPPKCRQRPFPRRLTREFVLLSSHHVRSFSNKQPKGWRRLIHSQQSGIDAPERHDARKPGPARTLADHCSRYQRREVPLPPKQTLYR